ncbi:MAG: RidA family protein [Actinobacteria bacterium]|nr:RidA family protein [Actinomycetota bacterium]MCG2807002.1 RidA family protein [Coriobacteriia bacterium]
MSVSVADRLAEAGIVLPPAPQALGDYVPAIRCGDFVYTSGQLPMVDGQLVASGIVGADVDSQSAADCARVAVLNALAAASAVCELDDVIGVVKLVGYVASAVEFSSQPAVLNAASAVLIQAFGDAGKHAREAIGVCVLPMNAPVEVSLVLSLSKLTIPEGF